MTVRGVRGAAKAEYILLVMMIAIAGIALLSLLGSRLMPLIWPRPAQPGVVPQPDLQSRNGSNHGGVGPAAPSGRPDSDPSPDDGPWDPDWLVGEDPSTGFGDEGESGAAGSTGQAKRFRDISVGLFDGPADRRNRARRKREDARDLSARAKVCGGMAADPATDPDAARVLREHSEWELREADRLLSEAAELEEDAQLEETRLRLKQQAERDPNAVRKLRELAGKRRKESGEQAAAGERLLAESARLAELAQNPAANELYRLQKEKESGAKKRAAESATRKAGKLRLAADEAEADAVELERGTAAASVRPDPAAVERAEHRAQSKPLRESRATLGVFPESAFNPGAHQRAADGANHVSVASYVLESADNPWIGVYAGSQDEFQQRIVLHELAHALYTDPNNASRVRKFLKPRWDTHSGAFQDYDDRATKRLKAIWSELAGGTQVEDPAIEMLRIAFQSTFEALSNLPDGPKRREKLALLGRDRNIAAVSLVESTVEAIRRDARAFDDGRKRDPPQGPIPSRFPGDLHALENDREFFAVAVELYFFDPARFRESYTPEEQAVIAELLDGDGKDDLSAVPK